MTMLDENKVSVEETKEQVNVIRKLGETITQVPEHLTETSVKMLVTGGAVLATIAGVAIVKNALNKDEKKETSEKEGMGTKVKNFFRGILPSKKDKNGNPIIDAEIVEKETQEEK